MSSNGVWKVKNRARIRYQWQLVDMGVALSCFLNQRAVIEALFELVEHLTGVTLFNGSYLCRSLEGLYLTYFDTKIRQKVNYDITGEPVDHENPKIVGRHRRPAHALLRSFQDKEECMLYWANPNRKISSLHNIHFLTGEPGIPLNDKTWSFLLVGTPQGTTCLHIPYQYTV